MKTVFIWHPSEVFDIKKNTTFALLSAAHRRGHETFFVASGGITLTNGQVVFHARPVEPRADPKSPLLFGPMALLPGTSIDGVLIRTDPPFDEEYLLTTWLLDRLPERVAVINNPTGIRTVNEKIWAMQFADLIPPTLITRHHNDLIEFIRREGDVIVKPSDGFGGASVFRIKKGDHNTNVILETITRRYERDIIMQRYIPEAENGDKRILLLNGEPLGALLRVHGENDHRNNFFAGGKAMPADITPRDREVIATLKPHLQNLGLHFVGIDMLGDYLTEINVTAPTCLLEMNDLYGKRLEEDVLIFLENRIAHS